MKKLCLFLISIVLILSSFNVIAEEISDNKKSYIIEFNQEPLLKARGSWSASNAVQAEHNLFKRDIFNTDRLTSSPNDNEIKEFKNVFNGLSVELSEEELEKVERLPYVKNIYEDKIVQAFLEESVPLINADDVWELVDNDEQEITGKNIIVAVIDTGIDYTHPDLGATVIEEREFEKITEEALNLWRSIDIDQSIRMDNNRIAYYSGNNIYVHSLDTGEIVEIDTLSGDLVSRLALKDNYVAYFVADNELINSVYLYDLDTQEHIQIATGITGAGYISVSNGKVVYGVDIWVESDPSSNVTSAIYSNIYVYDIESQEEITISEEDIPNMPVVSGNLIAYPVPGEYCYEKTVIYNMDTNEEEDIYPPDIGPILDFEGNQILYVACSTTDFDSEWRTYYLYDIETGEYRILSEPVGEGAESEVNTENIMWISSWINKGAIADNLVFFSKDINANKIVAYDLELERYVDINLLKTSGNLDAVGDKVCFLSTDRNIYCHDYDSNYDYPLPESIFNDKVIGGYDFVNNDGDPTDDNGHGTHVAGIIAANGGVKGVAPDALLYAYKVLDSYGNGWESDIIAAVDASVDPNGDGDYSDKVDVISMSLGTMWQRHPDDAMSTAVDNAVSNGVVAVIAAGNSGPYYESIASPGTARKAITVGSSTHRTDSRDSGGPDRISWFSSRGHTSIGTIKPDVLAPGGDVCEGGEGGEEECERYGDGILSARAAGTSIGTIVDDFYTRASGTSMAAPHVSGAVALIKQKNPDWSPDEIKHALRNTAVDLGYDILTQGYGRINVLGAVQLSSKPAIAWLNTSGLILGVVEITGTATSDDFSSYIVEYSDIEEMVWQNDAITLTDDGNGEIEEGVLGTIDTSELSGTYYLRLSVFNEDESESQDNTVIIIYSVDEYEPDDDYESATLITTYGTLQHHSFVPAGDVDYVKFWAIGGNEYTIRTSGLVNGADTVIYLYDTDGVTQIGYNDDEEGWVLSSKIVFYPEETGTYYVKVRDYWSDAGGEYDIAVEGPVPENKLVIESVEAYVNGERDDGTIDVKPEDSLKLKIEVENLYDGDTEDIEIKNILIKAAIMDIDDGDDFEEESDKFDLNAGDSETETIEFEIPLRVIDGPYDLEIEVEGVDGENPSFVHTDTEILTVNVNKAQHDVRIYKASLHHSSVPPGGQARLSLMVINLGRNYEDEVVVTIENPELGINIGEEGIELSDDPYDDDSEYITSFMIDIPADADEGFYTLNISTYYDQNILSDFKELELIVGNPLEIAITPEDGAVLYDRRVPLSISAKEGATCIYELDTNFEDGEEIEFGTEEEDASLHFLNRDGMEVGIDFYIDDDGEVHLGYGEDADELLLLEGDRVECGDELKYCEGLRLYAVDFGNSAHILRLQDIDEVEGTITFYDKVYEVEYGPFDYQYIEGNEFYLRGIGTIALDISGSNAITASKLNIGWASQTRYGARIELADDEIRIISERLDEEIEPREREEPAEEEEIIDFPEDPSRGEDDAEVVIVEFSDFECPFCAIGSETLRQVEEEYEDQVRIVFKNFPLSFHPNAQKAAEASECAFDQGMFWEMHDIMFENQEDALTVDDLKDYAEELGLDTETFDDCLDSDEKAEEVADDIADGESLEVSGTPTFFINGRILVGAQPFEEFQEIIDEELAEEEEETEEPVVEKEPPVEEEPEEEPNDTDNDIITVKLDGEDGIITFDIEGLDSGFYLIEDGYVGTTDYGIAALYMINEDGYDLDLIYPSQRRYINIFDTFPYSRDITDLWAGEHIIDAICYLDGQSSGMQSIFTIDVNEAPEIVATSETPPGIKIGDTYTFGIIAEDPNGDELSYSWYDGGELIAGADENEYDFEALSAGEFNVTVVVSDGELDDRHSWILNVVGAPVIDSYTPAVDDPKIPEDGEQVFVVNVSDVDKDILWIEWYVDDGLVDYDGGIIDEDVGEYEFADIETDVGEEGIMYVVAGRYAKSEGQYVAAILYFDSLKELQYFIDEEIAEEAELIEYNGNDVYAYSEYNDNLIIWTYGLHLIYVQVDDVEEIDSELLDAYLELYPSDLLDPEITKDVSKESNYTFTAEELGDYEVMAVVSDGKFDASQSWLLTVSDVPITDEFDGDTTDFSELDDLSAVTDITLERTGNGRIDFGDEVMDLNDTVDIDNYVAIEPGIVALDSSYLTAFEGKSAQIKIYNIVLPEDRTLKVYYNEGFTTDPAEIRQTCPGDICSNIDYDPESLVLSFEAAHFSSFMGSANTPPSIVSAPVLTARTNAEYRYDVDAEDEDDDVLAYELTTKPDGMEIDSDGVITWTPTSDGSYNVVVSVTDGYDPVTQSFTIEVSANNLKIAKLRVFVDGEKDSVNDGESISKDAKPGSKVIFKVEVENIFDDDMEIEDITVGVTIKDIDDGEDIDDEAEISSIEDGKDDTVSLDFEIPYEVEEDTYDVFIEVEGTDEDNVEHKEEWKLELDIDKDKHDVIIRDVYLMPGTIKCTRSVSFEVEVINIGSSDEDAVSIEIKNPELGLELKKTGIELDEGIEDNRYEFSDSVNIDSDVEPGIYPVTAAVYRDGELEATENVDLIVEDCKVLKTADEVVSTSTVISKEPKGTVADKKIKPETATEITFKGSDEYFMLLIIANVILVGMLVYAVGAIVILSSKRR